MKITRKLVDGDPQERRRRLLVFLDGLVGVLAAADQHYRTEPEQHGNDDRERPVRQQREQASGDEGEQDVHGERGRDATAYT